MCCSPYIYKYLLLKTTTTTINTCIFSLYYTTFLQRKKINYWHFCSRWEMNPPPSLNSTTTIIHFIVPQSFKCLVPAVLTISTQKKKKMLVLSLPKSRRDLSSPFLTSLQSSFLPPLPGLPLFLNYVFITSW